MLDAMTPSANLVQDRTAKLVLVPRWVRSNSAERLRVRVARDLPQLLASTPFGGKRF